MASKSKLFANCAVNAAISAIALYNQPYNNYREDSFCILTVNAWELLLKAKIIKDNQNKLTSIYAYSRVKGRKRLKRNRAGSAMTIGISKCVDLLDQNPGVIDGNIKENLAVLIELRDNAVHFINTDPALSDRVFRVGAASLINFFKQHKNWFGELKERTFAPLPLAFHSQRVAESNSPTNAELRKVVDYIDEKIEAEQKTDFSIAVQMQVSFVKEKKGSGTAIRITNDPNAPEIRLSEEDFQQRFPLDYHAMCNRAKAFLPGLKINSKFNALALELRGDPNLCHTRYLDPKTKRGSKRFYSEAMIARLSNNRARLDFAQ